jgi:hypothetical protein
MNWRDLLVISPLGPTVRGRRPPAPPGSATGAFVTAQSITSFPVASGLVFAAWKGIGSISPTIAASRISPFVVALAIGLLVYVATLSDRRVHRPEGAIEWASSVGIACANSLLLWVAALGLATFGPSGTS